MYLYFTLIHTTVALVSLYYFVTFPMNIHCNVRSSEKQIQFVEEKRIFSIKACTNLLPISDMLSKHRKNCECCPSHYLSTSAY